MAVNIFGQLDRIDKFSELSYKNKGTIIRFLKAAGAVTVSALLVAATGGVLFPAEFSPAAVIVLTAGLQAADKWFRENKVEKEFSDAPLTDTIETDSELLSETAETEGGEDTP